MKPSYIPDIHELYLVGHKPIDFYEFPYPVIIDWSDWIHGFNEDGLGHKKAVYMFADENKTYYIGKAGKVTVRERLQDHERKKKKIKHIKELGGTQWPIKTGLIYSYKYSLNILKYTESLLIHMERKYRNGCWANTEFTATRDKRKNGLVIFNCGHPDPLVPAYADDEYLRFWD